MIDKYCLIDALLEEELFGPIFPVIKTDYVSDYQAIQKIVFEPCLFYYAFTDLISSRIEHPLAIYIFSTHESQINESEFCLH
jgi:hypothetical protein